MLMDKITSKNQTLTDPKFQEIILLDWAKKIDKNNNFSKNNTKEFKEYEICFKGSSLLKNIISNLIRTGLKIIYNKKLIPKRIKDSNIYITVDIIHMSNEQCRAAILIAFKLSFFLINMKLILKFIL